jgi:hypothetical protein
MKELLSNEKKKNPLLMYPFNHSNIIHKQIQLESKVDNLASYLQLQRDNTSKPAPFVLSGDDSVNLSDSLSPSLKVSHDGEVHSLLSVVDQNVDKIIKYVNYNNNKIVEHLDNQLRSDIIHESNLVNDLESYLRPSTGHDDGFEPSYRCDEGDLNEKSFEYGSNESEPLVRQSTPFNRYQSPKDNSKSFSTPKEVSSRNQSPPSRGADLPALMPPSTDSAQYASSLLSSLGFSGPSTDPRFQRSSAATKVSPAGDRPKDNRLFVLPAHSREVGSLGVRASNQLSFQDQVYRFAEIKALFEVASPGQEQSVYSSSVGSGSHSAFEDPKLNDEIKRHKERIINGRNNAGSKSPRSQIHKLKAVARQHRVPDSSTHTQGTNNIIHSGPAKNEQLQSSSTPIPNDTGSTSAKVQQIQEQIQLLQLQLRLQHIDRQSTHSQQPPPQKNILGAGELKQSQLSLLAADSKASLPTESSPRRMVGHRGASSAQKPPMPLLSAEAFSEAADK